MSTADVPLPPELAVEVEPFTDWELGRYLEAVDDVDPTERPLPADVAGYRITADDQAEWAGRKLALAAERVRVAREQAEEWIARIEHNFETATKADRASTEFFESLLADYGLRVRQAGGAATLHLPSVTVTTSHHQPAVKVDDDDIAADRLRAIFEMDLPDYVDFDFDDLVKITRKVYVGPLRKLVRVAEVDAKLWDWEAILDCGHSLPGDPVGDPRDFIIPDRGDVLPCPTCDPEDFGVLPMRAVATIVTRPRKRLVAVGPDGAEIPGLVVSEESYSVKVTLR